MVFPSLLAMQIVDAQGSVDLLLQGGTIHRGDGSAPLVGDVAIKQDRIVYVGKSSDQFSALQTIDCAGMIVCPGFIDLHNHSDGEILVQETRSAMNYLTQGCTTMVTGNCGSGPVDVAKYYDAIDQHGSGPNIMHLLPQGSLRRQVMGSEDRRATDDEMESMRALAEKAMKDGAWGMSTGLIYVPSSYADTEELSAIAEVVGRHNGIYASHIRGEGLQLLQSVEEALEIGKQAKLPVHISHFKSSGKDSWGLVRRAVAMIQKQREAGQVITADQYPYTASSTSLGATFFPAWSRAGGRKQLLARIDAGDDQAKQIEKAIRKKIDVTDNAHRIQIASYSVHPDWAGRRLDEIAQELGIETYDLILQIERSGGASIVNHSINEDDVRFVMQQRWVATASDGSAKIPGSSVPHPRNYGTFPRRLGFYARDQKVISLEHAIYSSTGLPAKILGVKDRGLVEQGLVADLVVFDPDQLIDRSTFIDPHQYSQGVRHLLVNGKPAILNGHATGALAGRALRHASGSE